MKITTFKNKQRKSTRLQSSLRHAALGKSQSHRGAVKSRRKTDLAPKLLSDKKAGKQQLLQATGMNTQGKQRDMRGGGGSGFPPCPAGRPDPRDGMLQFVPPPSSRALKRRVHRSPGSLLQRDSFIAPSPRRGPRPARHPPTRLSAYLPRRCRGRPPAANEAARVRGQLPARSLARLGQGRLAGSDSRYCGLLANPALGRVSVSLLPPRRAAIFGLEGRERAEQATAERRRRRPSSRARPLRARAAGHARQGGRRPAGGPGKGAAAGERSAWVVRPVPHTRGGVVLQENSNVEAPSLPSHPPPFQLGRKCALKPNNNNASAATLLCNAYGYLQFCKRLWLPYTGY